MTIEDKIRDWCFEAAQLAGKVSATTAISAPLQQQMRDCKERGYKLMKDCDNLRLCIDALQRFL